MPTVAIIGGGTSGLAAAAAALKEGLEPKVFEMSYRIGGVWGPDDRDPTDHGSAWPGMQVNISRHTGTFSDFSWPKDSPDFPTTQEVYDYLSSYAKHHQLLPYIQFGSRVVQVFPKDKKWVIRWQEKQDTIKEAVFDSVIIATSKFTNPHIPDFKGIELLKDKMIHSAEFRSANDFIKKNVLIVGGSLSGTSLAENLSKITTVTHLIRKERWMIKRYRSSDPQNDGPLLPRDLLKSLSKAQEVLSSEEEYKLMQLHCPEQNDCPEWRMHPHSPVGFVVADEYFDSVRKGTLKPVKGDIKYFTQTSVVLQNDQCINFDYVIFCTGYQRDLSFLPEDLRLSSPLYEDTFPPHAEGIAYIGMYPGARGAVIPLVQLQAELACKVMSGKYQLPAPEEMVKEISTTPSSRGEIQFSSALAKKLGVLPDLNSFNPGFRHILVDGAYTPARFLLMVSGQGGKALKMIVETENYRRRLLRAKDKIPSLASLCLFRLPQVGAEKESESNSENQVLSPELK